jgi:hypothetical protein
MLNLGYADHFAQILFFVMNKQKEWKRLQEEVFLEEILKILSIYGKRNNRQRFI